MSWNRRHIRLFLAAFFVALIAATSACQAQPQQVEVTRIVESEPQQVEVEVTRIVEGTPERVVITATPSEPGEPIALGLYTPLSGPAADLGDDQRKGMTLAVEQINSEGGVLGRPLQLYTADNTCSPDGGTSAARELIELRDVSVLLGGMCSGATLGAMEVMQELTVPGVTTGASSPAVTEQGNTWEFRINAHDEMMAEGFSQYIADQVDSVMLLVLNDEYGRGADAAFRSFLESLDVEIMGTEFFERGQADYRSVLTRIDDADPEGLIVVGAASDANVLVRQYRELGMDQPLFTRGILDSEFVELIGDDCSLGEGMTSVNYWTYGADEAFQEAYRARWGEDARFLAAVAYYGTRVIADAIERAGSSDPAAIRDALVETDIETGMGPVKFDENRQAHSNIYITVLRDCNIELLEVIEQEQP